MRLVYISRFQFKKVNDKIYSLPAYENGFWDKYLDVFDTIHVIGEPVKAYLDNGTMVELTDKRITVDIIPSVERPKELINYHKVAKYLEKIIRREKSSAFLVKPSSRKGLFAIKCCEKYKKPYMIEMTGDVKTTLDERNSILFSLYGSYLYNRTLKGIRNCKFGLYVTEQYLQSKYPISGVMCGCTDSIIPKPEDNILEKRIKKINEKKQTLIIGLIGYYHDTRKGIDSAIDALKIINSSDKVYQLHILGVGTEEDREKWRTYAAQRNVDRFLLFPHPLNGSREVANWIDTVDLVILPSRSEGFPRAIAESMSRACPAVTSNVCGLQEMVEEKWQHNPGDYKELADKILKITGDLVLMQEAAEYNLKKAEKYDFEYLRVKRNNFLNEFRNYSEDLYKSQKKALD